MLTWTQVNATNVECSHLTPSYCSIHKQLNVDNNEDLIFTPTSSPLLVSHFEMGSPAQLKWIPKTIFSQFTELQSVEIKGIGLETLTQSDFTNANHLTNLNLKSNQLNTIESATFVFANQLDALVLSDNRINEIQDDAFKGLTKLRTLKLDHNQISVLKQNILSGLESLEYLFLYKNKIEIIESGALNLPKLKEVFFGFNKLTVLPDDLFSLAPSVELVEFANNELKNIGEAFTNCQMLSYINLENNQQLKDAKLLKFAKIPALQTLSLNNTGLREIDDMSNIVLTVSSQLRSLNLANNRLTDPALFRYLSIFKELKQLYLYNNNNLVLNNTEDARKYLLNLEILSLP